MGRFRVTVDTGGTFSDFVYLDGASGKITISKIPSTPDDPSRAIIAGVEQLRDRGVSGRDISFFCHGTTVGTNALLEAKGARTGLLITQHFRGIYEVAEQARPHGAAIFDLSYRKPPLLVPPSRTGEVVERIAADGAIIKALDETQLRTSLRALAVEGVQSIAVCLLFSFLAPAHERRVREIIAQEVPDAAVSLSCEIVPQIREYQRLSTTVINAYLQPILSHYIAQLAERLSRADVHARQTYIMQSNGGMAGFAATARKAVTTVLSGPAGGVTAAAHLSGAVGQPNLITFDMGGTSCDVALIKDGQAALANQGKVEGRDLSVPMMDINTVSAGGGTLAQVDRFGALLVGPQSAGASPGPACYSRGGTLPTVTDCNLLLGYLAPDNFLGGAMRLDADRARTAVEASLARPLNLNPVDAAEGVVRIINVKMEEAIKAVSTLRGHDLRQFMLLAFGGAGPLHAGAIADDLNMAGLIVPLHPGVFSAIGLMMSDVKHDYVRSGIRPLDALTPADINPVFEELEAQAVAELGAEGFAREAIGLERTVDLRYAGQGYELSVPCMPIHNADDLARLRRLFDDAHAQRFGHAAPAEVVELVSWRLRATGFIAPVELERFTPTGARLERALRASRKARFAGADVACAVYDRNLLDVGHRIVGPAIIEQYDCTAVLHPHQVAVVDAFKNIIVTPAGRTAGA